MIPDEIVERVRDAADIVEVVGEHVKLRRMGGTWRGPCPFHNGTNPNFSVSPQKGFYHCFKCGVSGDVFTFLREHLGLSFADAVREVGGRVGIAVPDVQARREERDTREPLWEALATAEAWFARQLWDEPAGREAREYLESRGIPRELAERFGLGAAPRDAEALLAHLAALGIGEERALAVGLVVRREGETALRPRFRGRLVFPIHDRSDRPAGFGGRVMGDGEPKYLNSPETDLFVKGRLLYHLHAAKTAIRREERALLVEGYFDVIRLEGAGIGSAVAPLGTALTPEQAEMLARLTTNVFLLYDSDEAGQKATFRSGLELLRLGVAPRVVSLPEGEDPDSYVRRHGADGMERALAASMDLFERQLQLLERRGWFADLHRTRRAIDKLLPTIRACADPLTRELYLGSLAERAKVDRDLLAREAAEPERRPGAARGARPTSGGGGAAAQDGPSVHPGDPGPGAPPPPINGVPPWKRRGGGAKRRWDRREEGWKGDPTPPRPTGTPGELAERSLVLAMLHLPAQRERIAHEVAPEELRDPRYVELFDALAVVDGPVDAERLAESLSPAAVEALDQLLEAAGELQAPARVIADSLVRLHERRIREALADLQRVLMQDVDEERARALLMEKARLKDELARLRSGSPDPKLGDRTA